MKTIRTISICTAETSTLQTTVKKTTNILLNIPTVLELFVEKLKTTTLQTVFIKEKTFYYCFI